MTLPGIEALNHLNVRYNAMETVFFFLFLVVTYPTILVTLKIKRFLS